MLVPLPFFLSFSKLIPRLCTGDIINFALESNKAFAVVPCCVFPNCFPDRTLTSGRHVRTYEDLIQWITERDSSVEKAELGVGGRQTVLFRRTPTTACFSS